MVIASCAEPMVILPLLWHADVDAITIGWLLLLSFSLLTMMLPPLLCCHFLLHCWPMQLLLLLQFNCRWLIVVYKLFLFTASFPPVAGLLNPRAAICPLMFDFLGIHHHQLIVDLPLPLLLLSPPVNCHFLKSFYYWNFAIAVSATARRNFFTSTAEVLLPLLVNLDILLFTSFCCSGCCHCLLYWAVANVTAVDVWCYSQCLIVFLLSPCCSSSCYHHLLSGGQLLTAAVDAGTCSTMLLPTLLLCTVMMPFPPRWPFCLHFAVMAADGEMSLSLLLLLGCCYHLSCIADMYVWPSSSFFCYKVAKKASTCICKMCMSICYWLLCAPYKWNLFTTHSILMDVSNSWLANTLLDASVHYFLLLLGKETGMNGSPSSAMSIKVGEKKESLWKGM